MDIDGGEKIVHSSENVVNFRIMVVAIPPAFDDRFAVSIKLDVDFCEF